MLSAEDSVGLTISPTDSATILLPLTYYYGLKDKQEIFIALLLRIILLSYVYLHQVSLVDIYESSLYSLIIMKAAISN